jgi:hypothetical protein
MNSPEGSRQKPPTRMEEPNPYSAAAGASTKLAAPMSTANSAKPTASDATLVSSSAGRASTTMSTIDEASRRSMKTNAPSSTTEAASRPIVLTSPHWIRYRARPPAGLGRRAGLLGRSTANLTVAVE